MTGGILIALAGLLILLEEIFAKSLLPLFSGTLSEKESASVWYIILGCMIVSALFAILFWLVLIVAKRSDEKNPLDFSEDEPADK